jgi:hypothetical protein
MDDTFLKNTFDARNRGLDEYRKINAGEHRAATAADCWAAIA